MPGNHNDIEKRLWDTADQAQGQTRSHSHLNSIRVNNITGFRHESEYRNCTCVDYSSSFSVF